MYAILWYQTDFIFKESRVFFVWLLDVHIILSDICKQDKKLSNVNKTKDDAQFRYFYNFKCIVRSYFYQTRNLAQLTTKFNGDIGSSKSCFPSS